METWYLGGWCLYLQSENQKKQANGHGNSESVRRHEIMKRSRRWLFRCLKLYELFDYEDERLHDHATELITELNEALGKPDDDELEVESGAESLDDEDWEDEGDNSDEHMEDD